MTKDVFTLKFFSEMGSKGGKKSSGKMTKKQLRRRAKKAAKALWDKRRKGKKA